tara:strand:+ start:27018 stop:27674 length:657 start_codon:yes stop_codon:yes gene_type:complete
MPTEELFDEIEESQEDGGGFGSIDEDADNTTIVSYISGLDLNTNNFLSPEQGDDIFIEFKYEVATSTARPPTGNSISDALLGYIVGNFTNQGADAPGGLSSGDITIGKDTTTTEEESYIEYYNWSDAPSAPEIEVGTNILDPNIGFVYPIIYSSTESSRLLEKFSSTSNEAAADFGAVLDKLLTDRSRILVSTFNVRRNSFIKTKKYTTFSTKNLEIL